MTDDPVQQRNLENTIFWWIHASNRHFCIHFQSLSMWQPPIFHTIPYIHDLAWNIFSNGILTCTGSHMERLSQLKMKKRPLRMTFCATGKWRISCNQVCRSTRQCQDWCVSSSGAGGGRTVVGALRTIAEMPRQCRCCRPVLYNFCC
jgi:hypothetical protein